MKRGFVDCPDGQIHYVTEGSGPPVVLLHSSPHSWNQYFTVLPMFAEHFQVVAMDTMGYGDSSRPNPPYTELAQYAQAVAWLIEGLGFDRAHVVGHLTGSEIATEVGAGHGDRLDRLVLSEVFNWDTPTRRAVHERIHTSYEFKPDGSHLTKMWERYARRIEMFGMEHMERMFFNLYRVNRGEQPAVYGGMGWDGSAPWNMCRYPLWDRVGLITAPTLLLHSENSDLRRIQPKLAGAIVNSTTGSYKSSNMSGPLEYPEDWSGKIIDFLKS